MMGRKLLYRSFLDELLCKFPKTSLIAWVVSSPTDGVFFDS